MGWTQTSAGYREVALDVASADAKGKTPRGKPTPSWPALCLPSTSCFQPGVHPTGMRSNIETSPRSTCERRPPVASQLAQIRSKLWFWTCQSLDDAEVDGSL